MLKEPVVALVPAGVSESPEFCEVVEPRELAVPKVLTDAVSRSSTLVIVFEVMVRFSMPMISKVARRSKKPTGPMPHMPMLRMRL